jgi:hypothetical protein
MGLRARKVELPVEYAPNAQTSRNTDVARVLWHDLTKPARGDFKVLSWTLSLYSTQLEAVADTTALGPGDCDTVSFGLVCVSYFSSCYLEVNRRSEYTRIRYQIIRF